MAFVQSLWFISCTKLALGNGTKARERQQRIIIIIIIIIVIIIITLFL